MGKKIFIPWNANFISAHEDFVIYKRKGRYCFNIDYLGTFYYDTMEEAQQGVIDQKEYVKKLLEEIDRKNKAFYEKRERELKEMLHKLRYGD